MLCNIAVPGVMYHVPLSMNYIRTVIASHLSVNKPRAGAAVGAAALHLKPGDEATLVSRPQPELVESWVLTVAKLVALSAMLCSLLARLSLLPPSSVLLSLTPSGNHVSAMVLAA